jgi:hypothetical protein
MNKKKWLIKIGLILMVSSGLFFAAGLIIPLTGLSTRTKVIASTTSFILMEVVFWTGGLLVGKELFIRYKSYFNPKNWRKKQSE